MTNHDLTCTALDERLGDYLEGALDDAAVVAVELHLAACPSCAALVRDLERLTRDAAALPPLAPSRDLWPEIAARLDTPVVSLTDHAATRQAHQAPQAPRGRRWHRARGAALAAGLVGITALVTWSVAQRDRATGVASRPESVAQRDSAGAIDSPIAAPGAPMVAADAAGRADTGIQGNVREPQATAVNASAGATPATTYDLEISRLRDVLGERGDELEPRTVAILESSLATIDQAIAEARTALERDPASRFLSQQLNRALEKKLGLLRTAALLPSRT